MIGAPDMANKDRQSYNVNTKYLNTKQCSVSLQNDYFSSYLTGLFEGDGHI